LLMVTS